MLPGLSNIRRGRDSATGDDCHHLLAGQVFFQLLANRNVIGLALENFETELFQLSGSHVVIVGDISQVIFYCNIANGHSDFFGLFQQHDLLHNQTVGLARCITIQQESDLSLGDIILRSTESFHSRLLQLAGKPYGLGVLPTILAQLTSGIIAAVEFQNGFSHLFVLATLRRHIEKYARQTKYCHQQYTKNNQHAFLVTSKPGEW